MMTTWKLAPALAAGCSVVLKPDSATPLSALRMAELAAEVGFPPGSINVVPGPGKTVGAHLVRHPGVDKIAFTGSTATGGEIMRMASDPIKRITLELGGKSPNVVFADADLDDAIPSSVWSIYYSAGQSCEARSRILVERAIYDDFVSRFSDAAGRLKVGDPLDAETQVGSLISREHRDEVHGFVERGREEGADVVLGGEAGEGAGAFYPPTVLAQVDNRMTVAQEAGRDDHAVRGREGRDPDRERRSLRPDGDGVDERSRPRAPGRASDQGGHGGDQHPVHGLSWDPVRRLQAVGLRAGARARDARALPRDEERARVDERETVQPVRPLASS
jgi:delta 1-pyrroline-5-carboxylate dehydrogenase